MFAVQTIVLYLCYIVLILLFSTAYNTSLIYCFVIWCLHTNERRPCSSTLSGHPSSSFSKSCSSSHCPHSVSICEISRLRIVFCSSSHTDSSCWRLISIYLQLTPFLPFPFRFPFPIPHSLYGYCFLATRCNHVARSASPLLSVLHVPSPFRTRLSVLNSLWSRPGFRWHDGILSLPFDIWSLQGPPEFGRTPKFIVWKGLETYFSPPLFYGNRFLFAPKKTLFLNMAMMFHPVPRWAMGLWKWKVAMKYSQYFPVMSGENLVYNPVKTFHCASVSFCLLYLHRS